MYMFLESLFMPLLSQCIFKNESNLIMVKMVCINILHMLFYEYMSMTSIFCCCCFSRNIRQRLEQNIFQFNFISIIVNLFVLRLKVQVNNFSVMSGLSHCFLGITSTFGE